MKSQTFIHLNTARKYFGLCAKKVAARAAQPHLLAPADREMLLGFGIAQDWLRWASSLKSLEFRNKNEQLSPRSPGVAESVRFSQMWTATNALFAKDSILRFAPALPAPAAKASAKGKKKKKKKKNAKATEAQRFQRLYLLAKVDPAVEKNCLNTLNSLFGIGCNAAGVTPVLSAAPTMWEVIDQKYSRDEDRKRGLGKVISDALHAKTAPKPDAPTFVYGARNWAVHGMLLTSFFRGSPHKYVTFINTITFLLSLVVSGAAEELEKVV